MRAAAHSATPLTFLPTPLHTHTTPNPTIQVGCAVLGQGAAYKVVLYDRTQKTLCVIMIGPNFSYTLQRDLYASFTLPPGTSPTPGTFSLKFGAQETAFRFFRAVAALKAHVMVHVRVGSGMTFCSALPLSCHPIPSHPIPSHPIPLTRHHTQGPKPVLLADADDVASDELLFVSGAEEAETVKLSRDLASQAKVSLSVWLMAKDAASEGSNAVKLVDSEPALSFSSLKVKLGTFGCPVAGVEQGLEGAVEGTTRLIVVPPSIVEIGSAAMEGSIRGYANGSGRFLLCEARVLKVRPSAAGSAASTAVATVTKGVAAAPAAAAAAAGNGNTTETRSPIATNAGHEATPGFRPAQSFSGEDCPAGWTFKMGDLGLGYYGPLPGSAEAVTSGNTGNTGDSGGDGGGGGRGGGGGGGGGGEGRAERAESSQSVEGGVSQRMKKLAMTGSPNRAAQLGGRAALIAQMAKGRARAMSSFDEADEIQEAESGVEAVSAVAQAAGDAAREALAAEEEAAAKVEAAREEEEMAATAAAAAAKVAATRSADAAKARDKSATVSATAKAAAPAAATARAPSKKAQAAAQGSNNSQALVAWEGESDDGAEPSPPSTTRERQKPEVVGQFHDDLLRIERLVHSVDMKIESNGMKLSQIAQTSAGGNPMAMMLAMQQQQQQQQQMGMGMRMGMGMGLGGMGMGGMGMGGGGASPAMHGAGSMGTASSAQSSMSAGSSSASTLAYGEAGDGKSLLEALSKFIEGNASAREALEAEKKAAEGLRGSLREATSKEQDLMKECISLREKQHEVGGPALCLRIFYLDIAETVQTALLHSPLPHTQPPNTQALKRFDEADDARRQLQAELQAAKSGSSEAAEAATKEAEAAKAESAKAVADLQAAREEIAKYKEREADQAAQAKGSSQAKAALESALEEAKKAAVAAEARATAAEVEAKRAAEEGEARVKAAQAEAAKSKEEAAAATAAAANAAANANPAASAKAGADDSSAQQVATLKAQLQEAEAKRKEEVSASVKAVLASYFGSLSSRLAQVDEPLPPAAFLKVARKVLKSTLKQQSGR